MRIDGIRGRSPNSVATRSELGLRPRIPFLIAGAAIGLQIVALGNSPYVVDMPWHAVWSFLAYSGLTLVLWIATDGKRPWLVPGAVMFLGAWMAALAAAASAAILTAAALSFFRPPGSRSKSPA